MSWSTRSIRRDKLRFDLEEKRTPLGLRPGDRITVVAATLVPAVVRRVSALTGYVHWRALSAGVHGFLMCDEPEGAAWVRGWLISKRDQEAFLAAAALERT